MASVAKHSAPKRAGQARHIGIAALLTIAFTPLVWVVLTAVYALPEQASQEAIAIDGLIDAHFAMISFLFCLILVPTVYALFVFRRDEFDEEDAEHIHGNNTLEALWIAIPTIIVLGFGVWGFNILNDLTADKDDAIVVTAKGFQWGWLFDYPERGINNSGVLVLPVDAPVEFDLVTIGDNKVLHSFWVPEWRVKQDVVPVAEGEAPKKLRVTPITIGRYKVRCAEICGTGHHSMRADVYVVSQGSFNAWVIGDMTLDEVLAAEGIEPFTEGP